MKYSFMSFSTPELSLTEMLKIAQRYGYDGIEPRLDVGHGHGIEVSSSLKERAQIKQQCSNVGIALSCLATSLSYADPAKTDVMLKQTHERIDLAGGLGVPVIRVFGGKIPDDIDRDKAIVIVANSLSAVAQHAADRNVKLCLETHDDWCDPKLVAAVMKKVNHQAVAVNWDIMHPVRTGKASMDEAFQTLKPWICHLHVHDGSDSSIYLPIDTGNYDHKRAIELLMTIDYNGFISGEWIDWEPYQIHLPRELATLKSYEKELA